MKTKVTAIQVQGADGKWQDPVYLRAGEELTVVQPFDVQTNTLRMHGSVDVKVRLVHVEGAA